MSWMIKVMDNGIQKKAKYEDDNNNEEEEEWENEEFHRRSGECQFGETLRPPATAYNERRCKTEH